MGNGLEFGKNKVIEGGNKLGIMAYIFYFYLLGHADWMRAISFFWSHHAA